MASTKFLEEALSSTDVDESAVSAMVCSLENQLVTSTPTVSQQTNLMTGINQNHVNCSLSNGGTNSVSAALQQQKLNSVSNGATGDSLIENKTITTLGGNIISGAAAQAATVALQQNSTSNVTTNYINNQTLNNLAAKPGDNVKVVYSQVGQTMTTAGTTVLTNNRVTFPNGTIGLPTMNQQQTTANLQTIQAKQQPTIVLKTSNAQGVTPGLVTLPMNVTASLPQVNSVGSPCPSSTTSTVLSNLQVVNVRTSVAANQQQQQQQKGTTRVVLSAPQMVGARPGAPQLTLQSFHGLPPGQPGHLLLKTENGQYQLLRVGPAPAVSGGLTSSSTPLTIKLPTSAPLISSTAGTTTVTTPNIQATTQIQSKPVNDNTKEKCRKFLANLLELSSREPRTVERNVRTLIQELIDARVEPEDFCDRLERLLNASPQPCLIGFLKKSLPLLRHALATKELSIEGIRPPPGNVVISMVGGTAAIQSQIRPVVSGSQVRVVGPGTTVVRPGGQIVQQRLMTPVRGALQPGARMLTTLRPPNSSTPVIVSNSQPPALHPVYPSNQIRPGNVIRQPLQVRTMAPGQVRPPLTVRTATPVQLRPPVSNYKFQGSKPVVPSVISKNLAKDKDKKSFSSAYTGDDDINDVAAMGGVNLAEETQRILGSTEFVGTQIRSCKEEYLLNMQCLQQRIKSRLAANGLDESSHEVAAVISHATQEKLKNMLEKLAIITEHRLESIKGDPRYEMTSDIKGQLKFLEDVDRAENKRHEETEREMLLRAAKSRSKTEDPEQAKLKAKAKEMQRVEMEELRQREANATALQAIGPRKRPRIGDLNSSTNQASSSGFSNSARGQLPMRARTRKATMQDLQNLFENEKDLRHSNLLYLSYLK